MEKIIESIDVNDFFYIVMIGVTISAIFTLILKYLDSSRDSSKLFKKEIDKIREKQNGINDSKKRKSLESIIKGAISDKEKEEYLLKLYDNHINTRIKEIDSKLKLEYENLNNPQTQRQKQLYNNFSLVRKRLFNEIVSLSKRANLNLTVGILSSIIAIGFLFYSGVYSKLDFKYEWFNFITYYIPKLSLILFIGTFSFYFLNLYKSNLGVIKDYQNELNNVDFKIISIIIILLSEDEKRESNLRELISQINSSQWNGILKNGETTIELQRMKENNSFDNELLNKLWILKEFLFKEKE